MNDHNFTPERKTQMRHFLVAEAEGSLPQQKHPATRRGRAGLWTAVILLIAAVGTGGTAVSVNYGTMFYTPSASPGGQATLGPVPDWPVNANGQTFGVQGGSAIAPDLILVQTLDMKPAYVYSKDLEAAEGSNVKSPEEAIEWTKAHEGTYVDILAYASDGTKVIGVFRIGSGRPFTP
ncbi:hypothetical protein E3O62_05885 [Cryobacterium sp. TMT2-15-1]|uniref:hypothetical protein n=1 Tax=Cryobacterium sp. TMT2-15-1 TaxID=1259246 RepID=UPI00106BE64F|nr:hypothetical protein [Cryobacterium sp. TMT2-15-1]TFC61194.1 hypothetical protein E3O62_05885 [Cryobacterium sp. TMT2-15-1]